MAVAREVALNHEIAACEALGLDPNEVRSLTIRFKARDVATVEVVFIPGSEHLKGVLGTLRGYKLVAE